MLCWLFIIFLKPSIQNWNISFLLYLLTKPVCNKHNYEIFYILYWCSWEFRTKGQCFLFHFRNDYLDLISDNILMYYRPFPDSELVDHFKFEKHNFGQ